MRGSRLRGERKGAHEWDEKLPTGCVGKDGLSEGCQASTPRSTEFALFGYMLMHALSIGRRGQGDRECQGVFSVADALWGPLHLLLFTLRTSEACICGSFSNWSHLELSMSVLNL